MSIEKLNNKTMDALNSSMRRFLWGKVGRDIYLAMIAWDKVCQTHEEGGLGIKNLKAFNTALLEILVWQLGAVQDRIWVKIVKAKYYPNGTLLETKVTRNTSSLWKALQECKVRVAQRVKWEIGDGRDIELKGQPWFEGWDDQRVPALTTGTLKVAELYNHQTKQRDLQEWRVCLGHLKCNK